MTRENNGGDFFNVDNYEADLEKAKQLLAEAGYPDGQGFPTVEYMTNDAKYHKPIAEYLQSAWKELGINTDIKIVEWSTFHRHAVTVTSRLHVTAGYMTTMILPT